MRVLVVHNYYRSENASGENLSVLDEIAALRAEGWDVEVVSADSDAIGDHALPIRSVALRPIYSRVSVARVRDAIERFRPHVALVENVFPLHSPWVIRTLHAAGIPVVAGVRSYRMFCAASTMYRDGAACRECIGTVANMPAVRHGCYQGSSIKTIPMAASLALHRSTFQSIDRYLAVSDYVRDTLIDVGFDANRIVVRPNFIDDPGPPSAPGKGFLFAGRLTSDKGVREMIEGWIRSEVWREQSLTVAGSGPLETELARLPSTYRVQPVGLVPHTQMLELVAAHAVTVVPSLWPEPFGRGVIEAAAHGRASIVCRTGGVGGLVEDGVTGWVASPDAAGLADAFLAARGTDAQSAAGRAARVRYEQRYTRAASMAILNGELHDLAHRDAIRGSRPSRPR